MRIQEDPFILARLKSLDVRIRKSYKEQTAIFIKDSQDPRLNNHELHDEYEGLTMKK